ncbi:GntR family transcriptional repressor for pyruvate dehydrogenase complex [Mesorhizobium soli]|uniref:FadR/GntR family transcriptional regulator n=1 Tax=Pseudaminobacter soli (ex Li et al. 2025) TaxID=1295366 RepID=UPI002475B7DD|nr:FadR/GntR family transcriptional regulator [Mesorhizobium soli]MDH6232235.1 GntR family transcriptional repressor for pyruvate dehydrogenase complex [Mesorhizobium soli]
MNSGVTYRRGNLTESVIGELLSRIENGGYTSGQKLPTEQEMCQEFGVSRTVVREAVASLRLGGRLVSRPGLGVFVGDQDTKKLNFAVAKIDDIRSAIRILELRIGVELESVALAATRRTPDAIADITNAYDKLAVWQTNSVEQEAQADFDFHLAIARATNNSHFPQFLEAVGQDISFDLRMKHEQSQQDRERYVKKICREHGAILSAIMQGDPKAARTAMRRHLEESLIRYRRLVDSDSNAKIES